MSISFNDSIFISSYLLSSDVANKNTEVLRIYLTFYLSYVLFGIFLTSSLHDVVKFN
jgi:hypothetical protein